MRDILAAQYDNSVVVWQQFFSLYHRRFIISTASRLCYLSSPHFSPFQIHNAEFHLISFRDPHSYSRLVKLTSKYREFAAKYNRKTPPTDTLKKLYTEQWEIPSARWARGWLLRKFSQLNSISVFLSNHIMTFLHSLLYLTFPAQKK